MPASIDTSIVADTSTKPASPPLSIPRQHFSKLPILMFHYIREVDVTKDPLGYNLSFKPASFAALLAALKQKGYQTIHIADLLDPAAKIPDKPILLTFDDGYEDFYTNAWPLLQKNGFTAGLAIIIDRLDQSTAAVKKGASTTSQQYLDAAQLKELAAAGIDIFSHTVTHADLSKSPDQPTQLTKSKKSLKALLNQPITTIVYPSGKYNAETLRPPAPRTTPPPHRQPRRPPKHPQTPLAPAPQSKKIAHHTKL